MKQIVVAGAGQLGSRHLQALKGLGEPAEIFVIDPMPEALQMAEERFLTIEAGQHPMTVRYQRDYEGLPESIDLAIVASGSGVRRQIVCQLLEKTKIRYMVLEKILFTQLEDLEVIQKLLTKKGTKAWVNCAMRMIPLYRQLRERMGGKKIVYHLSFGSNGLVTTLIHQLDFLAFLTGCTEFALDTAGLDKSLLQSKRKGYYELSGTVTAHFADGSEGIITGYEDGGLTGFATISTAENRLGIDTQKGILYEIGNSKLPWKTQDFGIPFQSTLTTELATSLFTIGTCLLPTYEESSKIHRQMMEPICNFLKDKLQYKKGDFPFS